MNIFVGAGLICLVLTMKTMGSEGSFLLGGNSFLQPFQNDNSALQSQQQRNQQLKQTQLQQRLEQQRLQREQQQAQMQQRLQQQQAQLQQRLEQQRIQREQQQANLQQRLELQRIQREQQQANLQQRLQQQREQLQNRQNAGLHQQANIQGSVPNTHYNVYDSNGNVHVYSGSSGRGMSFSNNIGQPALGNRFSGLAEVQWARVAEHVMDLLKAIKIDPKDVAMKVIQKIPDERRQKLMNGLSMVKSFLEDDLKRQGVDVSQVEDVKRNNRALNIEPEETEEQSPEEEAEGAAGGEGKEAEEGESETDGEEEVEEEESKAPVESQNRDLPTEESEDSGDLLNMLSGKATTPTAKTPSATGNKPVPRRHKRDG